jgi:hypothetical protein
LKGLFGGGAATAEAERDNGAARQDGRQRRGDGRGGRHRRRSPAEQARAQEFIQRYTTGDPAEGFASEEAIGYLRELRQDAPPEVWPRAAAQTVQHLPPAQRQTFAEMLERREAGTGMVTIERSGEARAAQQREGGAPGGLGMEDMLGSLLGGLLGGSMAPQQPAPRGGGTPDLNPLDDLLGGLFASRDEPPPQPRQPPPAPQPRGGVDEILSNPLGKAVLSGLATFAMKEMLDRDGRL